MKPEIETNDLQSKIKNSSCLGEITIDEDTLAIVTRFNYICILFSVYAFSNLGQKRLCSKWWWTTDAFSNLHSEAVKDIQPIGSTKLYSYVLILMDETKIWFVFAMLYAVPSGDADCSLVEPI